MVAKVYQTEIGTGLSDLTLPSGKNIRPISSRIIKIRSNFSFGKSGLSNHIVILRFGMFIILACLIAVVGATSFFLLQQREIQDFETVFKSSVNQISYSVNQNLKSKLGAVHVISSIFEYAIDDGYIGTTPNITLPGFEKIMTHLGEVTPFRSIVFSPLLTDKTRRSWQAYAKDHVDLLGGPQALKISQQGSWTVSMGIYNKTFDGKQVPDLPFEWRSSHPNIATPVWQIAPISSNYKAVMHNPHSMKQGGRMDVIDKVISTTKEGFTDIVFLVQDATPRPSTILYSPVINMNTSELVGLVSAVMSWDDLLANSLGAYVAGIYCVLSTRSTTYTFLLGNGEVTIIGAGDRHDTKYDDYGRVINAQVTAFTTLSVSDFVLTLYPSQKLYDQYVTDVPIKVCGGAVGVMAFTVLVILLYDYLIIRRAKTLAGAVRQAEGAQVLTMQELELKKQFVRYISHEIRTPLNTLTMGLDVLKQEVESRRSTDDILRTVEEIKESCDIALEVVNDFLLFDKIQSQSLNLELSRMNIVHFIKSAVKPFHLQARKLGITLTISQELSAKNIRNPQNINIDKHKMTQVVRNLLSNALKFTPKGGKVLVRIRRAEEGNDSNTTVALPAPKDNSDIDCDDVATHVHSPNPTMDQVFVVEVVDNGAGISKENQKKLFKEVVQFNPGLLQEGGGSGLGMCISYGIMQQHGGNLTVFSQGEGFGSTFTIEIPVDENIRNAFTLTLKKGTAPPADVESFKSSQSQNRSSEELDEKIMRKELSAHMNSSGYNRNLVESINDASLSTSRLDVAKVERRRILVVDDAATNRKMLCRVLANHGSYDCQEADNGRTAVDLVKQNIKLVDSSGQSLKLTSDPYDAVLIDFVMPLMTGPEAVKAMRELGYRGLVIGVTGHTSELEKDAFINNGADNVLVKPVDVNVIMKVLGDYFSSRHNSATLIR